MDILNEKIDLFGLILAGGASTRMQTDKGSLVYHQMPQYAYLHQLLDQFCKQVYISGRKEIDYQLPTIHDESEFKEYGPLAGLLSAYKKHPGFWIVIAVDYPNFGKEEIAHLIKENNITYHATVIFDYEKQYFEPFLGIYSPTLLEFIKNNAAQYKFSAQKILQHEMVKKVHPLQSSSLLNVNTYDHYQSFIIDQSSKNGFV